MEFDLSRQLLNGHSTENGYLIIVFASTATLISLIVSTLGWRCRCKDASETTAGLGLPESNQSARTFAFTSPEQQDLNHNNSRCRGPSQRRQYFAFNITHSHRDGFVRRTFRSEEPASTEFNWTTNLQHFISSARLKSTEFKDEWVATILNEARELPETGNMSSVGSSGSDTVPKHIVDECVEAALKRPGVEDNLQLAFWVQHELDQKLSSGWYCIAPYDPISSDNECPGGKRVGGVLIRTGELSWPRNEDNTHDMYIRYSIGPHKLEVIRVLNAGEERSLSTDQ